jgi:hypothetical protein
VQSHPDSIQPPTSNEALGILCEIGHAVLPGETHPY